MPPHRLSDRLADLPYASSLSRHQGDLVPDEDYEGVHFDGLDSPDGREEGTKGLLDQLGTYLASGR